MFSKDPTPGASTSLYIYLQNLSGMFINSVININFVNGFVINSSVMKCRILSP